MCVHWKLACVCVHLRLCMLACACVCVCPSLYSSVMNSQLMKEPLLLPFHQPGNNYLVSEAILHLYHTLRLHLATISLKIQFFLFLSFFVSLPLSLPYPFSSHFATPLHPYLSKTTSLTTRVSHSPALNMRN